VWNHLQVAELDLMDDAEVEDLKGCLILGKLVCQNGESSDQACARVHIRHAASSLTQQAQFSPGRGDSGGYVRVPVPTHAGQGTAPLPYVFSALDAQPLYAAPCEVSHYQRLLTTAPARSRSMRGRVRRV
jgi:hypothetical protein